MAYSVETCRIFCAELEQVFSLAAAHPYGLAIMPGRYSPGTKPAGDRTCSSVDTRQSVWDLCRAPPRGFERLRRRNQTPHPHQSIFGLFREIQDLIILIIRRNRRSDLR